MKQQIVESLLALISGCSLGLSGGLGLWPKYKQPKNIKIQGVFGVVGLVSMLLLLWYMQN